MVALEALANARPVLGVARGGLPWIIGAAGWVVEPTVEALAAGLRVAHTAAPALAGDARLAYETRFSPQVATDLLLDVYGAVTRAGGSGST
jgi:glycosyltransferase involved in cell wall biosynthesis